ncbi:(Fe-S)-binding protein [Paenibacillus sp. UNC499MF]|uniref:(Fe-S)-binding protein n=1 Tax=Paenibacillus sp. UNC499MF TaxID=1502751 RepID=UPI0008A01A7A|nr:(Fe-S)-binding protein [Paenibacillus sp. UNC499MF]SEF83639.1 4Fe-4S dicluster domain-containing protein [Paenibacillus sp. UNC499MF]
MAEKATCTTSNPLAQKLKLRLDEDQLTNCMRCGFCLPACPTFRETGIEAESPRGRIALMKAVADGIMAPDAAFEEQMNHCLGCRACEPACPADVKYGQLIEQARDAIEDHTDSHRGWVKLARRTAFKAVFPKQNRMKLLGGALGLYQRSGLQKIARGTGIMKLFPDHMREMEQILPEASSRGVIERIGSSHPAVGAKIATVGLFRGCLMDVMFTDTNVHTVELLTQAGFEVVIPETQNCCGALHAHSGEADGARSLARGNIRAFREAGVDYIVSNAGGCGAILTEYDHLLHEDAQWKDDAAWFAARVKDVSDLLVNFGRVPKFAEQGWALAAGGQGAPAAGVCAAGGGSGAAAAQAAASAAQADATAARTSAGAAGAPGAPAAAPGWPAAAGGGTSAAPADIGAELAAIDDAAAQAETVAACADRAAAPAGGTAPRDALAQAQPPAGPAAAAPSVRITYQDSCHLRNVMRSSDAPRKLMRQVAGVEYVEMFEADRCCGSAGIYNLTQPDMANQILDHKMVHANATDARYLLTSNPGCLLQMKLGNERHGDGSMKVMHVVDFLHERLLGDR